MERLVELLVGIPLSLLPCLLIEARKESKGERGVNNDGKQRIKNVRKATLHNGLTPL